MILVTTIIIIIIIIIIKHILVIISITTTTLAGPGRQPARAEERGHATAHLRRAGGRRQRGCAM